MKLLDCTLRDGGYLTNWDWKISLVKKYLEVMSKYVDIIELGYRSPKNEKFHKYGDYRFCDDAILGKIFSFADINPRAEFGVMVDLKDYVENGYLDWGLLENNFYPNTCDIVFDWVRIAISADQWDQCKPAIAILKDLGYKIIVSVMKCSTVEKQILQTKEDFELAYDIDVMYIADSFGACYGDIMNQRLDQIWARKIIDTEVGNNLYGIHCHNHLNMAFANCINTRVHYCDGTICGLGRGPGNCDIEDIIAYRDCVVPEDIENLRKEHFEKLKLLCDCHTNNAYRYSAINNIHPRYVDHIKNKLNIESEFGTIKILEKLSYDDYENFNSNYKKKGGCDD